MDAGDLRAFGAMLARTASRLLDILGRPNTTFHQLFAEGVPFVEATAFGVTMVVVSSAAALALGVIKDLDASAALFVGLGTVAIWLGYALFMHLFVLAVQGKEGRGFRATATAYLFTIGALQPVFVALLGVTLLLLPGSVEYRKIVGGIGVMGGSGGMSFLLAAGHLLPWSSAIVLRSVCGALVLFYLTLAIRAAHAISLRRAVAAVAGSFALFGVAYVGLYLLTFFVGLGPVYRLLEGT